MLFSMAIRTYKGILEIPGSHENVYEEFINGNFVVQKTNRKFSAKGLDQAHEHNDSVIKHTSKGIQTDLTSLMTFVGPEIALLLDQYESNYDTVLPHHEDNAAHERTFSNDVFSLKERIAEYCNPFSAEVNTLIRLNSSAEINNAPNADACALSVPNFRKLGPGIVRGIC